MINEISLDKAEWNNYHDKLDLNQDAIHIFKIEADKYYNSIQFNYENILSDIELAKSDRFFTKKNRERYVASKHSLRSILSKFVFIQPVELQFYHTGNKKPAINGIEFNSTHSENVILIVLNSSSIGIDVEFANPAFDFSTLLPTCFSKEEQVFINSPATFYLLWTRKEAILKATGEGLIEKMQEINCLNKDVLRKNIRYEIKSYCIDQYIFSVAFVPQNQQVCFWSFY